MMRNPTGSVIDKHPLYDKIFLFWHFLYAIFCQDLLVKHARRKIPGPGTGKSARGWGLWATWGRRLSSAGNPGTSAIAGSSNPRATKNQI